ncbi:hypothetical protein KEJ48_04850 [Candidatus Bathyarchaeota archaeon]|nr:hypothetical protein [Candidatus Bathyarchaeota archaeon]
MIDFNILVAVFFTLCVYSFVYKESPFWRIAEQTFIGLALGYTTILAIKNIVEVAWIPISTGKNYWFIGSIVLGLMLYTRFIKKYAWASRWPMAILIGIGTGVAMRTVIEAQIIKQISATFISLVADTALKTFNNICIVIMVTTSLFFFTFTGATGKVSGKIRTIGRYTLMLTFGATFGYTVLTRMTLFIGRFSFLWSPVARYYFITIGVIMIIALALKEKIEKFI